jgi:hypothetical protein
LRKRLDAHVKCFRDREALGIERIDQATDTWCDAVIVVEVVAAGRLHAAHIEQQRGRVMDGVGVRKNRMQQ